MPQGAYGFTFDGLAPAPELVDPAPPSWPVIDVRIHPHAVPAPEAMDGDHAVFPLRDGSARLDRRAMTVDCALGVAIPEDVLAHPLVTGWSSVFALWHGREVLHAGGAIFGGGVWALMGGYEAGKSTTLAALALEGVPVIADDLLVIAGGDVLAGPRCVDLRPTAVRHLDGGASMRTVRGDGRLRLPLGPVPAAVPLRGLISLAWGPEVGVRPLSAPERLRLLMSQRCWGVLPSKDGAMLDLATLRAYELTRPADVRQLPAALDALRAVAAPAG